MPIRDGIIKIQRHLARMANFAQASRHPCRKACSLCCKWSTWFPTGRSLRDASSSGDILHPSFFRQIQPRIRIELRGIPTLRQLLLLSASLAGPPLLLLMKTIDGVKAPVNEHSKAAVEPPIAAVAKSRRQFEDSRGFPWLGECRARSAKESRGSWKNRRRFMLFLFLKSDWPWRPTRPPSKA